MTLTLSPVLTTSSTFSTLLHSNSEICINPSLPGANSTNAPNVINLVIVPSNSIPSSGSIVMDLITSIASLHLWRSKLAAVTIPSSSTLISHSVSAIIFLIFFPPGPIKAPILSGLICKDNTLGAYFDISIGSGTASYIVSNI